MQVSIIPYKKAFCQCFFQKSSRHAVSRFFGETPFIFHRVRQRRTLLSQPRFSGAFSITFPKRFPFFSPGFSRSIVENFLFFVYNNKVYPCPFFVVSRPFFRYSPSGRKIHRTLFPLSFRFMDRVDRPFSLHHFQ